MHIDDVVVWVNDDTHEIVLKPHSFGCPEDRGLLGWCDPIGAAYLEWREMTNSQRASLMLETAIDLTMQGYALRDVLVAFSQVQEFRDLGNRSYPMCRALTQALIGRSLEPNTMGFDELLKAYAP